MTNASRKGTLINNEGCLRGVIIFAIVLLVLVGVLALVLYLKPQNMVRYGLITSLTQSEEKIGLERTLPDEQYEELKVYIKSAKKYITEMELDRAALGRLGPVTEVFNMALKDNRISRDELAEIRTVMWRSNIPLEVPKKNKTVNTKSVTK